MPDEKQKQEIKQDKKPEKKGKKAEKCLLWSLFGVASICLAILGVFSVNRKADYEKRQISEAEYAQMWDEVFGECKKLFSNGYAKEETTKKELQTCYDDLGNLKGVGHASVQYEVIEYAISYKEFRFNLEEEYRVFDTKPIDELSAVVSLEEKDLEAFDGPYLESAKPIVDDMRTRMNNIENAQKAVAGLFENGEVPESVNRDDYNAAREAADRVSREDVRSKLDEDLAKADGVISERERIAWEKAEAERLAREAAERERQARIAAAWHYVNVEYISQNHEKVLNGCEVASLLMALKYKGQMRDTSLQQIADAIPKTNDPYEGFYLDIYGVEPRDVSHWVDSRPLTEFGRDFSGYMDIYDLKGQSLDSIATEIMDDNPVVIWLTYDFKEPYNWSDTSKMYKNLHVMVLSGYNSETRQFRVTDPWTRNDGTYIFTLEWDTVAHLYEKMGSRAVVVR